MHLKKSSTAFKIKIILERIILNFVLIRSFPLRWKGLAGQTISFMLNLISRIKAISLSNRISLAKSKAIALWFSFFLFFSRNMLGNRLFDS